jgi:hypothetical protein
MHHEHAPTAKVRVLEQERVESRDLHGEPTQCRVKPVSGSNHALAFVLLAEIRNLGLELQLVVSAQDHLLCDCNVRHAHEDAAPAVVNCLLAPTRRIDLGLEQSFCRGDEILAIVIELELNLIGLMVDSPLCRSSL